MRKSAMIVLALAVVSVLGSVGLSQANHCGTNSNATAHDPFGSCENAGGDVSCGAGTDAQVATISTASSGTGVQACNDDGPIPPYGRASVRVDSSNNVIVGVDGDKDNPGSNGWSRLDVRPGASSCKAQLRRGSSNGTYYTSGGGTSNPDAANNCAG